MERKGEDLEKSVAVLDSLIYCLAQAGLSLLKWVYRHLMPACKLEKWLVFKLRIYAISIYK